MYRHASTVLNSDDHTKDRLRGWMDLPLSEQGIAEAHTLAKNMIFPDVLLSSDLKRATQTAHIMFAANHGMFAMGTMAPDFRPWNIGEFAGRKASQCISILCQYADIQPLIPVPGGESFDNFRRRLLNGILRALDTHKNVIGIVTHYRCIRLMCSLEKAGWRLDGSIDREEFARKGGSPAQSYTIEIPVERLRSAAAWPVLPESA